MQERPEKLKSKVNMNEFSLINRFFKSIPQRRDDVIFGIGDDAACLRLPPEKDLVISCDTLVADIHFVADWDAYNIAYKAVMANVSDIAAMGGTPGWLTLALTLPAVDEVWLGRFAKGLGDAMSQFNLALIGGDTTKGPLSMTIGIHGTVPQNKAVRRSGAKPGDFIFVSGPLGAAAQAVALLDNNDVDVNHKNSLMDALLYPKPRIDLNRYLLQYASSAIDISDGLAADLNHILEQSQVGACLFWDSIPVHPLLELYQGKKAVEFAIKGGDDYELCLTVPAAQKPDFIKALNDGGLSCFPIGMIEQQQGLRARLNNGEIKIINPGGYSHF